MAHCTPHRVGEASATELGTQNAPREGSSSRTASYYYVDSKLIYDMLENCLISIIYMIHVTLPLVLSYFDVLPSKKHCHIMFRKVIVYSSRFE